MDRHGQQHNAANAQRASQTPPLSLTLPKSAAHHHRAAVQSNEVYPSPPASARRVSFGWASDKRFPLGGFEECFGNTVTDPVVRRVGKLGLFHLRRRVPCEGFRLRRCLRTPAWAARPGFAGGQRTAVSLRSVSGKFAKGAASLSLVHGC